MAAVAGLYSQQADWLDNNLAFQSGYKATQNPIAVHLALNAGHVATLAKQQKKQGKALQELIKLQQSQHDKQQQAAKTGSFPFGSPQSKSGKEQYRHFLAPPSPAPSPQKPKKMSGLEERLAMKNWKQRSRNFGSFQQYGPDTNTSTCPDDLYQDPLKEYRQAHKQAKKRKKNPKTGDNGNGMSENEAADMQYDLDWLSGWVNQQQQQQQRQHGESEDDDYSDDDDDCADPY